MFQELYLYEEPLNIVYNKDIFQDELVSKSGYLKTYPDTEITPLEISKNIDLLKAIQNYRVFTDTFNIKSISSFILDSTTYPTFKNVCSVVYLHRLLNTDFESNCHIEQHILDKCNGSKVVCKDKGLLIFTYDSNKDLLTIKTNLQSYTFENFPYVFNYTHILTKNQLDDIVKQHLTQRLSIWFLIFKDFIKISKKFGYIYKTIDGS